MVELIYLNLNSISMDPYDYGSIIPQAKLHELAPIRSSKRYREWLGSQWLRRYVLSERFNLPLNLLQFKFTAKGRPWCTNIPHIDFNIAHSGHWVVMALAEQPIGVDIENLSSIRDQLAIARHYFSYDEYEQLQQTLPVWQKHRFYQLWTLKEAYLKQTGLGITAGLNHLSFHLDAKNIQLASKLSHLPHFYLFYFHHYWQALACRYRSTIDHYEIDPNGYYYAVCPSLIAETS